MPDQKTFEINDNGIALFDGYFPAELCNSYISYFEGKEVAGLKYNRWTSHQKQPHQIEDSSVDLYDNSTIDLTNGSFIAPFLNIFWNECYKEYANKFSILSEFDKHQIYTVKMQKTEPGQGYHVWHTEVDSLRSSRRLAAYILYLNDVTDGGETEFLYLKRRVQPKQGRLMLWPSGYVHTHRGNPPLSGTKYILTGWLEF